MNIWQVVSLERPSGLIGWPRYWEDMTYMLPAEAQDRRLVMLDIHYERPMLPSVDPIIIFDRDGRILHAWPEDYIPGPAEIEKVGRKLMDTG